MTKLFKNKKVIMATSLFAGVIMLSVPTFAEITSKTGYDKLKDSIKQTSATICKKANNYTFDVTMTLKDNDKVTFSTTAQSKVDNVKKAQENIETTKGGDNSGNSYYYRDSKQMISSQGD